MTSKKIIERLKQQDWYVKCETEHELALVLNACLDSGLHWASGDKASFIPESMLNEISVFIARDTFWDKKGICWGDKFFQTYNSDCEDITDWFFEELRNEMEKLTPQNEHQEHMVQVLLAKMQGIPLEYKSGDNWYNDDNDAYVRLWLTYRIASKTPLPITREIWQMLNKKWKLATADKDGSVWFHTHEPSIDNDGDIWLCSVGDVCRSILNINTDGIDWKRSLTKRPEDI